MTCHGNSPDSPCCRIPVGVDVMCKFLVDVPGRKGGCGLLVELGSWDAVHADERYLTEVQPHWIWTGTPDCGDWVGPGCCYPAEHTEASLTAKRRALSRPGTPVTVLAANGWSADGTPPGGEQGSGSGHDEQQRDGGQGDGGVTAGVGQRR